MHFPVSCVVFKKCISYFYYNIMQLRIWSMLNSHENVNANYLSDLKIGFSSCKSYFSFSFWFGVKYDWDICFVLSDSPFIHPFYGILKLVFSKPNLLYWLSNQIAEQGILGFSYVTRHHTWNWGQGNPDEVSCSDRPLFSWAAPDSSFWLIKE